MTNEEIDKLEGRELDAAFAEAFDWAKGLFAPTPLDHAIAVLPDEWLLRGSVRLGSAPNPPEWFATIVLKCQKGTEEFTARGFTAATALCRAALKAKAAARSEAT